MPDEETQEPEKKKTLWDHFKKKKDDELQEPEPEPEPEKPKKDKIPGVVIETPVRCPGCNSMDNKIRNTARRKTHIIRYRYCCNCQRNFISRLSLDTNEETIVK